MSDAYDVRLHFKDVILGLLRSVLLGEFVEQRGKVVELGGDLGHGGLNLSGVADWLEVVHQFIYLRIDLRPKRIDGKLLNKV